MFLGQVADLMLQFVHKTENFSNRIMPCYIQTGFCSETGEDDPALKMSASFVHSENPQVLAETFLPTNKSKQPKGMFISKVMFLNLITPV